MINCLPIGFGGCCASSRLTNGAGVSGLAGIWLIISGGAGTVTVLASCINSLGAGGVGGLKYQIAFFWKYSSFFILSY